MRRALFTLSGCLVAGLVSAAEIDFAKKLPLPVPRKVVFETEVWPILKESCLSCHGPEKQKGKYRVDSRAAVLKNDNVVPGQSEKSPFIHMVAGLVEEGLMPPPSDKPGESVPLTREQIGLLRAWIDQGATWPEGEIKEVAKQLTFSNDVITILTSCLPCHGKEQQAGNFRADTLEGLLKGGQTYGSAVRPKDTAKSPLLTIIAGKDEDLPHPDKHKLSTKQVDLVRSWVEQGAK